MPSSCHFFWVNLIDDRLRLELVGGNLDAERHGGAEDGDLALVAGHDGGLAAQVERADQAGAFDDGDLGVVALVLGPLRDIDDAAVAVVGVDGELLAVVAGHDAMLGRDGDLGDGRVLLAAVGSAGGDPAADELVFIGADFHAFAAGVGHDARPP